MILFFAMVVSAMIIVFSFVKGVSMKNVVEEGQNQDLELYFTFKTGEASAQVLLKQLIKAAASFREKAIELEREMEILGALYEDRMISEDHWDRVNEESRACELEKMCIESEANAIKPGYGSDIFKDASKAGNIDTKRKKKTNDDLFYLKRKEVLEAALLKRITLKNK